MENKVTNILIVGVGGQGTLLASKLLGKAFVGQGYDVKVSEVHGMSQRQKSSVNAVVQKSVNLYNIAGKNLSLARNALLQKFHAERPPCFRVVRSKKCRFFKKSLQIKAFLGLQQIRTAFP